MRPGERHDEPEAPVYVLGVNTGPHDGSAALLRDGRLVAMLEQERLSRRRYAFRESPSDAIAACLTHAGIGLGDVAEIAIGWDVPALVEIEDGGQFDEQAFTSWLIGSLAGSSDSIPSIRYVQHHLAHAASAFWTSGLDEAAVLVVDGRGEDVATTLAVGGPGGIEVLETWGTHLSLGHLYGWAAEWAGLTMWGAGKLMGLASYGRPRHAVPVSASGGGYTIANGPPADASVRHHYMLLRSRLRHAFRATYPFAQAQAADVMAYADFAASIQRALEDVLLHLAARARAETGLSALVLAGGVGLNCSANGSLARTGLFDELWIPPVPHDAGVSLGAALVADHALRPARPRPQRLPHARWAPVAEPSGSDLAELLVGCELERLDDARLCDVVARHLADGRLVAWCRGRGEVGQRALGARSILCDPRARGMLVHANTAKGREAWRPLAPAILAEHAAELFDDPLPPPAEFMLVAAPVREAARTRLPAAVHVDGSARPQLVWPSEDCYRRVIEAFYERTGVPAVINTSLNLAGEPVVHSPEDAVSTFLRSDIDVLVVDDLVAVKREGRAFPGLSPAGADIENLSFIQWQPRP